MDEPIYKYTRSDAIADGTFIDVTEWAKEVGFIWPVCVTHGLWAELNSGLHSEDLRGRAHDVLMLARIAAKSAPDDETLVEFTVRYAGQDHRLWMTIEVENDKPGLTIMRPEDY